MTTIVISIIWYIAIGLVLTDLDDQDFNIGMILFWPIYIIGRGVTDIIKLISR